MVICRVSMTRHGAVPWPVGLVLMGVVLACWPNWATAQLTDENRVSTSGTQFVRPEPQKPTPLKKPPPRPVAPRPQTAVKIEPVQKVPDPLAAPPRYPAVIFVVDTSDSMMTKSGPSTRLDAAKLALSSVLARMAPEARVQVFTFNTRISPLKVAGQARNAFIQIGDAKNRKALLGKLRTLRTAGGTNLYRAIVQILAIFADPADQAAYQNGQRFPVLVVVSDGEDSGKTREKLSDVFKARSKLPLVTINTIGFLVSEQEEHFKRLCSIATRKTGCAIASDQAQLTRLLDTFHRYSAK